MTPGEIHEADLAHHLLRRTQSVVEVQVNVAFYYECDYRTMLNFVSLDPWEKNGMHRITITEADILQHVLRLLEEMGVTYELQVLYACSSVA